MSQLDAQNHLGSHTSPMGPDESKRDLNHGLLPQPDAKLQGPDEHSVVAGPGTASTEADAKNLRAVTENSSAPPAAPMATTFDSQSNPVAHGLLALLVKAGIDPRALDNEGAKDDPGTLTVGEVFQFMGTHLADPKVQQVLAALDVKLTAEEQQDIGQQGFGKFMATRFTAEAHGLEKELKEQDPPSQTDEIARLLLFATFFEPENPSRFIELADFYATSHAYTAALQAYASALEFDPDNGEVRKNILTVYELATGDTFEQVAQLQFEGDTEAAMGCISEMLTAYEITARLLPEKFQGTEKILEVGDLYFQWGELLKTADKPDQAKKVFAQAIKCYQTWIDANKTDPKCIQYYKQMGHAAHEMGDYTAAAKSYMLASQCKKLIIHYDPQDAGQQLPDIHALKHDRSPGAYVGVDAPTGNYIPSEVHDIEFADAGAVDALPDWANFNMGYFHRLNQTLSEHAAERTRLAAEDDAHKSQIYDLLVEEVKILNFLSRPKEAAALAQEAALLKDMVTLEKLHLEVTALQQAGLIDEANFNAVSAIENENSAIKFFHTNFADFEPAAKNSPTDFCLNEDYLNLPTAKKIKVLNCLIQSAERTKLTRSLAKAKGAAKLFFSAQLALFDGDTAGATTKFQGFQDKAAKSKDPRIKTLLEKTRLTLQALDGGAAVDPKQLMQSLKGLLGPLVLSIHRDHEGRLALANISQDEIQNLADFQKYLATQVSVDGVAFNQVWMASYEKVMQDPRFAGLMKCLYAEFKGEAYPEQDTNCLKTALIAFEKELANVSFGKFIGAQMDTAAGREHLQEILKDEMHYSVGFRANLLEEIIDVGERQGFVPQHLRNLFEQQLDTYLPDSMADLRQMVPKPLENFFDRSVTLVSMSGDTGISERELRLATQYGLKILRLGNAQENSLVKQVEKYHRYAQEVQRLNHGKLNGEVTTQDIKDMAALIKEKQAKCDDFSVLQVRLAKLWLLVVDDQNWTTRHTTHLVSREQRALMVNQLETFLQEAKTVHSNEDFLKLSKRIRRFLRGQGEGKGNDWVEQGQNAARRAMGYVLGEKAGQKLGTSVEEMAEMGMELVGSDVDEHFEGMTPAVASAYQDLLRFTDEFWAAENMGMHLDVQDPPLKLGDAAKEKKTTELISQLRGIKRGLWYNYKQRNMLSRGLSPNMGDQELIGDTAQIRLGIKEIDGIISDLQNATSNEDLTKIKQRLTQATQAAGAIHVAYQAAEMDGWEQAVNLAETIGEILLISVVSRGIATEGALVRGAAALRRTANLRKSYRGFRVWLQARKIAQTKRAQQSLEASKAVQSLGTEYKNYRSLSAKIAQALEGEAGFTAKAAQGFKMGSGIVLTMNFGGMLTGQLKATPTDILDILKEVLATGGAMAISAGLAPEAALTPEAMAQARENIIKYCWTRYTAQGARGALTFMADTGLEIVEEVADAYILKFLNGDYSKLSWDELKDIIIVCVGGGGMKMGALKKFIDQGREIYHSQQGRSKSEAPLEANSGLATKQSKPLVELKVPKSQASASEVTGTPDLQLNLPDTDSAWATKPTPGNDNAIPSTHPNKVSQLPIKSTGAKWAAAAAAGVAVSLEGIPEALAQTTTALGASPHGGMSLAAGVTAFFVGMAFAKKKPQANSDHRNVQAFLDLAIDWGALMIVADEDKDLNFIEEVKEDILRNSPRTGEADFSKKLRALENIIDFFIRPELHPEAYRDLVLALAKTARFDVAEKLILKGKLSVKYLPTPAGVDGQALEIIARERMAHIAFEQGALDGEANPLFQLAMLEPDFWYRPLTYFLNKMAKEGKLSQAIPVFDHYAQALAPHIIDPQLVEDMRSTLIGVQMGLTGGGTGKLFGKIFDGNLFSSTLVGLGASLATLMTPKIAEAAVDAAVSASQGPGGLATTILAAMAGGLLGMAIGKGKDSGPLDADPKPDAVLAPGESGDSQGFQDSEHQSQQNPEENAPPPPQLGKKLQIDDTTLGLMEAFPASIVQRHQANELNPVFFGLNHLKWWMGLVRRDVGEWGSLALVQGGKILFGRWQEDVGRQEAVTTELKKIAEYANISQQLVLPPTEAWFRPLWEQALLNLSTESRNSNTAQQLAAILQVVERQNHELAQDWLLELAEQDVDLSVTVGELMDGELIPLKPTTEENFPEKLAVLAQTIATEAWENVNAQLAELYSLAKQQKSLTARLQGIRELQELLKDLDGKDLPVKHFATGEVAAKGADDLEIFPSALPLNPLLMEGNRFTQQVREQMDAIIQSIPTGISIQDKARLYNYLGYISLQLGSKLETKKYFTEARGSILTMTVVSGHNDLDLKEIIDLILATQNGTSPPFPDLQSSRLETDLAQITTWEAGLKLVGIPKVPLIQTQALAYLTQMFHGQAQLQNSRAPLCPQVAEHFVQAIEAIEDHWCDEPIELHMGKSILKNAALGYLYLKLGKRSKAKDEFDLIEDEQKQFPPEYFFNPNAANLSPEEAYNDFKDKLLRLKQGVWSFGSPLKNDWPWSDAVPIDGTKLAAQAAEDIRQGEIAQAIAKIGKGFARSGGWDAQFCLAYLVHILTDGTTRLSASNPSSLANIHADPWKNRIQDFAKNLGAPGQGLKLPGGNTTNNAALTWCYLAVALRKMGDVAGAQVFFKEADRANQYATIGPTENEIQQATGEEINQSKMNLWSLQIDLPSLTKVQALCHQGQWDQAFREIEKLAGPMQAKALALFAHEYKLKPWVDPDLPVSPAPPAKIHPEAIALPLGETFKLGRRLSNELVVTDEKVSKDHVHLEVLRRRPSGVEKDLLAVGLVDQKSTNGTFYRGKRLPAHIPVILRTGENFWITPYHIRIDIDPAHGADAFIAWEPGIQKDSFVIRSYPSPTQAVLPTSAVLPAALYGIKSEVEALGLSLEVPTAGIADFFTKQLNLAFLGAMLKKLGSPRGKVIIEMIRAELSGQDLQDVELELIEDALQGKLDDTALAMIDGQNYQELKALCGQGSWAQAIELIQKQKFTDQAFYLSYLVELLFENHAKPPQRLPIQEKFNEGLVRLEALLKGFIHTDWDQAFAQDPEKAHLDAINQMGDLTVLEYYYELKGLSLKLALVRKTLYEAFVKLGQQSLSSIRDEDLTNWVKLRVNHDYKFSEGMFNWEAGKLQQYIENQDWDPILNSLAKLSPNGEESISHFIGEILVAAQAVGRLDVFLHQASQHESGKANIDKVQATHLFTEPPPPDTDHFAALPLRDLNSIPQEYRHLIPAPQDIVLFPRFEKILQESASLISAPDRIAIRFFGPPGTGKTTFPEMIAQKMGIPLLRFPFSRRTDASDLEGLWTREKVTVEMDGETREELVPVFKEGAPTIALEHGFHLVLDEPDLARAGVLAYINNISAPGEFAWVRKDNGSLKKIRVHPDFRVYATENGVAEVAREEHGKDFLRRFVAYHVGPWTQPEVEQVLGDLFASAGGSERWPKKLIQTLAYFHDKMRMLAEGLADPQTRQRLPHLGHDVGQQIEFTPRSMLRLAQRLVAGGPLTPESLSRAIRSEYILPLADGEDREMVWSQAQAIFDPVAKHLGWAQDPSQPAIGRHRIPSPTLASISKDYLGGGKILQSDFVWTDQALRLADEILWNRSLGIDVMLLGEAGEGKTELPPQIARLLKLNYYQKTVSSETDEEDLVGGLGRTNGKIAFIPDIVTLGTQNGGLIHLDEYLLSDTGKLEAVMNPLMDATRALILKNPFGMIPRHDDTFILLTSNPPFGDYEDRNEHSGAAMSRVAVIFLADQFGMKPQDRKKIMRQWADQTVTLTAQAKKKESEIFGLTRSPQDQKDMAHDPAPKEAALHQPLPSVDTGGTRDFHHPYFRLSMPNQKPQKGGAIPALVIHPEIRIKYQLPASLVLKHDTEGTEPQIFERHSNGSQMPLQEKTEQAIQKYAQYLTRRTKVDMGLIGHRVFEILYSFSGNHSTDLVNQRIILNLPELLSRPIAAALGAGKHEWAHAEIDRPHKKYDAHEPGRLLANVVGDPRMNEYAASLRQDFAAQIESLYEGMWPKERTAEEIQLFLERVLPHEQFADAVIHYWRHGEIMPWIENEQVLAALNQALPILEPAFTLFPKSTQDRDVEVAAAQFYQILDRVYPLYEALFSESLKHLVQRLEAGATPEELIQEVLEMLLRRSPPPVDFAQAQAPSSPKLGNETESNDETGEFNGDPNPESIDGTSGDPQEAGNLNQPPEAATEAKLSTAQNFPETKAVNFENSDSAENVAEASKATPEEQAKALEQLAQEILNQRAEQLADRFEPQDPGRFEQRKEQITQVQTNAAKENEDSPDGEPAQNIETTPQAQAADASLNQDELRNIEAARQQLIQERLQNDLFSRMVSPQAMQMAKRLKRFVPPDNPTYLEGYFTTGKRLSRKQAAQEAMNPMSDGKVMLRRLRPGDRNANIVILSDVSESMKYAGAMENTLKGSADAIYLSEELKVHYGEILFQGDLRVAKPLGKPLKSRRKKNELLNLKQQAYLDSTMRGGTNLREPIAMALDWIQNKKAKTNYIILITDGEETEKNFPKSLTDLQREAREAGISILVLAMGRAHQSLKHIFDHVEAAASDGSDIPEKIIKLFSQVHQDRLKPTSAPATPSGRGRRGLLGGGGLLWAAIGAGLTTLMTPETAQAAVETGTMLGQGPATGLITGMGTLLVAGVLSRIWEGIKEVFFADGYPTPRWDELDNSLGEVKRNSESFTFYMNGTERVILKDAMTIAGIHFPGQAWLTLHYDQREFSYRLPNYQRADGLNLPAGTLVTFDQSGYVKSIALPRRHWIQQIPCSPSSQGHVFFHPNGQLQQAVLGQDSEVQGVTLHQGSQIQLDANGELETATLSQEHRIENISFAAGSQIKFNLNNRLHAIAAPAILGLDQLLHGEPTFAGLILTGLASASLAMGLIKPDKKAKTTHPYRGKVEEPVRQIQVAKTMILDQRADLSHRVWALQELVNLGEEPLLREKDIQDTVSFLLQTCAKPPVAKMKSMVQAQQMPDTDERILRTYAMGAAVELLKRTPLDGAFVKRVQPLVIKIAQEIDLSQSLDLDEMPTWSKQDTRYSELNMGYRIVPKPIWRELRFDAPLMNLTLEAASLLGIEDEIPERAWSVAKSVGYFIQNFIKKSQRVLGPPPHWEGPHAWLQPGRMAAGALLGGSLMVGLGLGLAAVGILPVLAALQWAFLTGVLGGMIWGQFGGNFSDRKTRSHQNYLKTHQAEIQKQAEAGALYPTPRLKEVTLKHRSPLPRNIPLQGTVAVQPPIRPTASAASNIKSRIIQDGEDMDSKHRSAVDENRNELAAEEAAILLVQEIEEDLAQPLPLTQKLKNENNE